MLNGNNLWNLSADMVLETIGNKSIYTYKELPPSFYHLAKKSALKFAPTIAVVTDEGNTYSYTRLFDIVDNFAAFLSQKHSVTYGVRVGVLFYNTIEFCVSLLALSRLGAVAVILPSKYLQLELERMISRVDAGLILCAPVFANWFEKIKIPTQAVTEDLLNLTGIPTEVPLAVEKPENDALIFFTSGTTAKSKTVLLKNYNITHAILSYQKILGITEKDKSIIPIPIYTVTGSIAILGVLLYAGGTVFLHKKFNGKRVLQCVAENNLTFIHASPTVFSLLLDERDRFPSVPTIRAFACGSSNMPKENIRRLKEWMPGAAFYTVYGLTETSSPATIMPQGAADSPFIGSSGMPIPGVMIKIVDPLGKELPVNEIGEIVLRGTVVIEQYLLGGENSFTQDGFLKTGDLGYINNKGYLYAVDRIKDMINRGGEKICSFDIENALHCIPGIIEAAVVGIPDNKYGEVPVAVVRCGKGYTLSQDEIKDQLKDKIAKFMIPVEIRPVESLLKTANGKIDKKTLRTWFCEGRV
jgi:fatty-acyl-CoA synthase/long-chain acyl-CoA synthetase